MFTRRQQELEQKEAQAEQRERESAAPRLQALVPSLRSLRMTFEDCRAEGRSTMLPYTRHVVVASCPALFAVRCVEPRCNGRHELTTSILQGLKALQPKFTGESVCDGSVGDNPCDRTLRYVCVAEYAK
jgi:hypothetical protein